MNKKDKFQYLRNLIGFECIDMGEFKGKEVELLGKFMDLASEAYVLIQWPESQEYMEEDWFDEEAILDVECKFGSSAYFIPLKRLL